MIKRSFGTAALVVVSLSSVLALSACEERPYPTASRRYEKPTAPPPAQLAGAPEYAAPAPQPAYAPPPPAYAPPARSYSYDAPAIVAMAPIPNPGDAGSDGYYAGGHRVHTRLYADNGYAAPRPVYHAAPAYAPKPGPKPVYVAKPAPKTYAAKPVVPVKPYTPPKDYHPAPPPVAIAKPVIAPLAAKVDNKAKAAAAATLAAAAVAAHDTAKAAADAKAAAYNTAKSAAPATPAPAANGADRSTRLASLQSALTDAISKSAALAAPDRFTANQPADVTLTIPKEFADTLRAEAGKDGLADAAASANMTAVLSGDGFSVTPDETQSQPLTVGQATEFRWTVTAQPGAKGPLHADVGADLLGGGSDTLALGSVQKSAGMGVKLNPRIIGASILVLIAALVVVWLARGRGPTRSATARRASRNARGAAGARPLDIGGEGGSAH